VEQPATERAAFLDAACAGDPALRREVESLLESDDRAGSFCERPAATLVGDLAPPGPAPRRLEAGMRLEGYEISALLGSGGMGEVYRARDLQLGRDVAIKIVGADAAGPAAKSRLLREARHASSLSHPNIGTIFEVGDGGGLPFIVMELAEGRPLRDLVREDRPSIDRAIGYGAQIAGALQHAHDRGIVHRDLKSSNVVIAASGRAIVLDFGLASRLPGVGAHLSETTVGDHGRLAGTISSMAPEVLQGGRADARSDIWALGVLLFEMFTGTLPFAGRTAFETSSAILGEPPRPMPRSVPLSLRLIVQRCLEKDPAARYQSAGDVAAALESARRRRIWPLLVTLLARGRRARWRAAILAIAGLVTLALATAVLYMPSEAAPQILALLPLENATGNAADEYYVDGLTEGLIAQLGALKDVRVIARASVMRYRGADRPIEAIARELGASRILRGAVHLQSGQVAIEIHLLEGAGERIVWSDRYEGGTRNVLALQAGVVKGIAGAVGAAFDAEALERLRSVRAVDPEVYEAYLKGRYYWNLRTAESLQRAVGYFTRALALDETYAPAHAALADCYNQLGTVLIAGGSPARYRPLAAAEAMKALRIDPYSAQAHAALGYVKHYDWEWVEAERLLGRAIELNPNYALARIWYANLLMSRGRFDEALTEVRAARDLDPFSLVVNANVGWVLTAAGRPEEAILQLQQTMEMDPAYSQARMRLSSALFLAGRLDDAMDQVHEMMRLTSRSDWSLRALAIFLVRVGRHDEAYALLEELLERRGRQYVPPNLIGDVYLALGEVESALDWLELAVDERLNAVAYFGIDPDFVALRGHPRFRALLARAGLE
jgi:eukaryotic-like serine/threonine-protein kinase